MNSHKFRFLSLSESMASAKAINKSEKEITLCPSLRGQSTFGRRGRGRRASVSRISTRKKPDIDPLQYPVPKTELDHWLWILTEQLILDNQGLLGPYVVYKASDLSNAEGIEDVMCTSEHFNRYVERVMLAESKLIFTTKQINWFNQHIVDHLLKEKKEKNWDEVRYESERYTMAKTIRNRLTNHAEPGEYDVDVIRQLDFNQWSDLQRKPCSFLLNESHSSHEIIPLGRSYIANNPKPKIIPPKSYRSKHCLDEPSQPLHLQMDGKQLGLMAQLQIHRLMTNSYSGNHWCHYPQLVWQLYGNNDIFFALRYRPVAELDFKEFPFTNLADVSFAIERHIPYVLHNRAILKNVQSQMATFDTTFDILYNDQHLILDLVSLIIHYIGFDPIYKTLEIEEPYNNSHGN
jgi:hypothetical protein